MMIMANDGLNFETFRRLMPHIATLAADLRLIKLSRRKG